MTYIQENKLSTKINSEWVRRLYLVDKDFKATIINIFKEPKESLLKEVKENVMTVSYQTYPLSTSATDTYFLES